MRAVCGRVGRARHLPQCRRTRAAADALHSAVPASGPDSALGHTLVSGPAWDDELYTSSDPPLRFIGAASVTQFDGKGRGVVTTAAARVGDALLIVPPLALLSAGASPGVPPAADLVDCIVNEVVAAADKAAAAGAAPTAAVSMGNISSSSSSSAGAAALPCGGYEALLSPWYTYLCDGTPQSTQLVPDLQHPPAPIPTASRPSAGAHKGFGGGGSDASVPVGSRTSGRSAGKASTRPGRKERDKAIQRLGNKIARVVNVNAFGEAHTDLAAAVVSKAPAMMGHIGLWPEFSFLNHSCTPNSSNGVLRRAMVVRAARALVPGEEVTICYQGRGQLAPLPHRQAALRRDFGFDCDCERCQGEARAWERVGQRVEALYVQVTERLAPAAAAAAERARGGDEAGVVALRELRQEADALLCGLYAQFRRTLVTPQLRTWLLAGCFGALELVADADSALSNWEEAAQSLATCLRIVAAVSPGSDLHCILAAQRQSALQCAAGGVPVLVAGGESMADVPVAAREDCITAQRTRYGRVSEALVWRLAELNRVLYA